MDLWILNNENYAVNYLNSLRIIVEGNTSDEYLKFRQELSREVIEAEPVVAAAPVAVSVES